MKITVSDYVIKFLERKGVSNIFTVSGGGSISLCDSLHRSKKIRYICCHHEQAASFSAEGYARAKKNIGCALVTTGPGGTNAITGVSSAWIDSVPVIFISGQVFLNQTIKNSKKRQIGVQEIDIISLVKPVTKYSVMIKDPYSIKYHLEKAYNLALSGRPGPVWIDIPADIQNFKIQERKLKGFNNNYIIKKSKKIDTQINKVAELLSKSNRPIIHIGHGVKLSKAENVFLKLINRFKIPFMQTWNADDVVIHDHKMNMGKPGAFGSRYSNFIIQSSDFYLSIGTRLPFMVTGYDANDYARKAKVKVMIDIDKNELKKNGMSINYKICCDAKYFIEKLNFFLKKINKINKWIKYCNYLKNKYPIVQKKFYKLKKYVNSYVFIDVLSKYLKENKIIITDMGFSFTTTHQAFKNKKNQILLTNSGHAPMGWGLPAAIGASCKGKKFQDVICLTGEGGFQMNIQELATLMHNKIPIKIFIFNNGGYLTIKQTQQLGFKGRLMGSTKTSGLSFPDYEKIAKSHKLNYFIIKNQIRLNSKIKSILTVKKPLICEILMDPNEEQIPKAINKKNKDGKSIPTVFEDMYPFLSRSDFQKMNIDNYEK